MFLSNVYMCIELSLTMVGRTRGGMHSAHMEYNHVRVLQRLNDTFFDNCDHCPEITDFSRETSLLNNYSVYMDELYQRLGNEFAYVYSNILFASHNTTVYIVMYASDISCSLHHMYDTNETLIYTPSKICNKTNIISYMNLLLDYIKDRDAIVYTWDLFISRQYVLLANMSRITAAFWTMTDRNKNITTCSVKSSSRLPFKISLISNNLEPQHGHAIDIAGDQLKHHILQSYSINDTYPNVTCIVRSPVGWTLNLTNLTYDITYHTIDEYLNKGVVITNPVRVNVKHLSPTSPTKHIVPSTYTTFTMIRPDGHIHYNESQKLFIALLCIYSLIIVIVICMEIRVLRVLKSRRVVLPNPWMNKALTS